MNFDLDKASRKLSELELRFVVDNLLMNILWFRVTFRNDDWIIKRHMHSSFEFHFIYSGSCKVRLDNDEFEAKAGEFYLTGPGVYHEQSGVSPGHLVEFAINCELQLSFKDEVSEAQYILKVFNEAPCKKFLDSLGIITTFYNALEEAYYQKLGFCSKIKSHVLMIIVLAARAMSKDMEIGYEIPLKTRKNDQRFFEIEKFIEDNIADSISTTDIAKQVHLSEKQVSRIVIERMGISTKEFIIQVRLRNAKKLLKETNLPIKEIAYKLGFTSEYYFNQFFKREEGYPPGAYRRNLQHV